MTLLTDLEIKHRLRAKDGLEVEPVDLEEQLQPASLDIRLGTEFREFKHDSESPSIIHFDDDIEEKMEKTVISDDGTFILHPDEFVLADTKEYFEIPDNILGEVTGRSSVARLGITVHQTAGLFDPGFYGNGVLEIKNVSKRPVAIEPGMRIAQMTFEKLSSSCSEPYNSDRNKYQGQEGAVPSKINEDKQC
jgi:dCTP deaminase